MAISVVFTISDAKGDQSSLTIPIPGATAYADIIEFAQDMSVLLGALSNGALRDVHFTVPVSFTPWEAAAAISDIQEKARFAFRTAGGFLKHVSIPAALESIFGAGSRDVDLTDTDVAAFVTGMVDGLTLSSTNEVGPVDIRDEDLTELESATEAWGRARR